MLKKFINIFLILGSLSASCGAASRHKCDPKTLMFKPVKTGRYSPKQAERLLEAAGIPHRQLRDIKCNADVNWALTDDPLVYGYLIEGRNRDVPLKNPVNNPVIELNVRAKKWNPQNTSEAKAIIYKALRGANHPDDAPLVARYLEDFRLEGKGQPFHIALRFERPEVSDEFIVFAEWLNDLAIRQGVKIIALTSTPNLLRGNLKNTKGNSNGVNISILDWPEPEASSLLFIQVTDEMISSHRSELRLDDISYVQRFTPEILIRDAKSKQTVEFEDGFASHAADVANFGDIAALGAYLRDPRINKDPTALERQARVVTRIKTDGKNTLPLHERSIRFSENLSMAMEILAVYDARHGTHYAKVAAVKLGRRKTPSQGITPRIM